MSGEIPRNTFFCVGVKRMSKTLEKEDAEMTAESVVGAGEIEKASSELIEELKAKSIEYSMHMKFVDAEVFRDYEKEGVAVVKVTLKAKRCSWFKAPAGWDVALINYDGNGIIVMQLVRDLSKEKKKHIVSYDAL